VTQADAEPTKPNSVTSATEGAYALSVEKSLSGRGWRFRPRNELVAKDLELAGVSRPLADLLAARSVTLDTLEDFLEPKIKKLLPNPSLLANMDSAAARIADAIIREEKVAVLGDYDVDGACASALVLGFFRNVKRDLELYIPDRMSEGYGPSIAAMEALAAKGIQLIITVDCGAAAQHAFARAEELGLEIVVLDHHAVETNPTVLAHVNPNGPDDNSGFGQLCAAGVTFLALVAITRILRQQNWFTSNNLSEPDLLAELDLVGLSTVTDVVPLTGVNRAFVRQGLRAIEMNNRPGFRALIEIANAAPPFGAYHLGFIFGPRINAGGRVGRCDLGARLLSTTDIAEATELAGELDLHNKERQAIEQMILERALEMASEKSDQPFLFLSADGWHPGVVGIVASRLKDRFEKPVFVAGFMSENDQIARGSARSVTGVDLGAIVRAARAQGLLESGGGHAMAAGFTVARARVDDFSGFLSEAFESQRSAIFVARDLEVESVLSVAGASVEFLKDLERAGPFGSGNPEPIFVIPDATLAYADIVGKNHVRLRLAGPAGTMVNAISFRSADTPLGQGLLRSRGKRLHVAGKLRLDDYKGRTRVQVFLEDAALAGG
jgi:single-stranded-DNA-specific exonuclease